MLLRTGVFALVASLVVLCLPFALGTIQAAEAASPALLAPPAAPRVSTFAPAADLVRQADQYIHRLENAVQSEEQYKDDQDKIAKEANTLVIIALALGLHDQSNKYQAQAGALMKAAQELAATMKKIEEQKGKKQEGRADFESVKKAVAMVREAAEGRGMGKAELKWQKVASLPELMKEVPRVNNNLKRYVKPEKFKSKAKEAEGCTAVIAAIAQGTMADTSEAKNPEQVKQWYKFSAEMRDAAGTLNAAIHKGNQSAATAAMKRLAQSCEDCHKIFHPGVIADQEAGGK
jgi:hypothetical protein